MGFFDFFKRLFKGSDKKQADAPAVTTINITDKGLEVNGELLDLPVHISSLERLFGEPRAIKYETSPEMRQFLEEIHGKGMVTNRVNYAWDELGLFCFTMNAKVVSTFAIRLSTKGDTHKHFPISAFKGTVLINGKPWFEVMKNAVDQETSCQYVMDFYSVRAEYINCNETQETRKADGFMTISIAMKC